MGAVVVWMMAGLYEAESESRIEELRSMIDSMLSETQMYAKIRTAIAEQSGPSSVNMRTILARLLSDVERSPVPETLGGLDGTGVSGLEMENALALRVELRGGASFVGEAVDASSKGSAQAVRAHLLFNGQRGSSALAAASVEPKLRGVFVFELARPRPRSVSEWNELLRCRMPQLRLCITRESASARNTGSSKRELVASGAVDWRRALVAAGDEVALPLAAAGPDSVLFGDQSAVLRLALEVVSLGDDAPLETPFDEETTKREIRLSATLRAEASRGFYLYAKDWWREFLSANSDDDRGVRVFAHDETGELRCVCSFVAPVRAGRCLDSPRHCSRFVSLIALEKAASIAGGQSEAWHSPHAMLARRAGDVWDHATLLCSLFLGFGLDAYVALGTLKIPNDSKTQPHAWVLTVSTSDDEPQVVAWESATGRRCFMVPLDAEASAKYATLACVFNDAKLFANRQHSDKLVDGLSLDFENREKWMLLDAQRHGGLEDRAFVSPTHDFVLAAARLDIPAAELALETELRNLVQSRRLTQLGLLTVWDNQLSYMLQPALAAYENERLTGRPFGNDDFQDAIRRHVPQGYCFKVPNNSTA